MPGGVNPSPTAVPDTTPKLHDSSLQQGDVAMLQEGQRTMKKMQKPATAEAPSTTAAPSQANMEVPDAIEFIGGRAGGTLDGAVIGQNPPGAVDLSRWRPLMEEIVRDPNTSGPLSAAMMSKLRSASAELPTVGIDVIDMNAAEDMLWESLR